MKVRSGWKWAAGGMLVGWATGCHAGGQAALPLPPERLYGTLFVAVQTSSIFDDAKTFVDALPRAEPATIVKRYEAQRGQPGFDLNAFVAAYFTLPSETCIRPPAHLSLRDHLRWLWPKLTRTTPQVPLYSSLIPLPFPYGVPGGRFREAYYWDTYFILLGLQGAGLDTLADGMLANVASLIDRLGFVPNGNRTYYLTRSQPPFFSHMVALAAAREGPHVVSTYLPQLRKEYAYWMRGARQTAPGHATRHVVVLPDGTVLNRYWDALDTPRPEAYPHDLDVARKAPERPPSEVYRDLRAAAESGWDFSSRWLEDPTNLATIRTTAIVPVDLNSLLFHLETTLAEGCARGGDMGCARMFAQRAAQRAVAIHTYLWNHQGYYSDYDWQLQRPRNHPSAAMLYPLFVGAAPPDRARATAQWVRATLLEAGGLNTTPLTTGQQWDAPNGWAPLQWIAIKGLERYGQHALARTIGTRFLARVTSLYAAEHRLVETYAVTGDGRGGGGGEYPLQDGFGWTNGVTWMLLDRYGAAPLEPPTYLWPQWVSGLPGGVTFGITW